MKLTLSDAHMRLRLSPDEADALDKGQTLSLSTPALDVALKLEGGIDEVATSLTKGYMHLSLHPAMLDEARESTKDGVTLPLPQNLTLQLQLDMRL